jgi:drug/metabolite transporter (DMT)-like permease
MARSRGRALTISTPAARRAMVWRALWGTCSAVATFSTLASPRISLGDTVTIFATGPMFIALLSWPLLREKVSPRVATAIGVSFAGIVLVVRPSFHVAPVEGCTALAATVFSSLAMISLRKMGPGESSEVVVFYFSAFASLVLMALSIPVFQWPDARGWGFLALTGLMGGLAQVAMTKAYSLAHAAAVSVASYLGLVFTRAIAVAVFGEIPTVTQVAGSVLIIACGLVLALRGEAGPQRSGTGARAVRG